MRLIGTTKKTNDVPGNHQQPYDGFGGYWRYARPMADHPGNRQTDAIVRIATTVYFLAVERLIYGARNETFKLTNAKRVVRGIAKAIAADLKIGSSS